MTPCPSQRRRPAALGSALLLVLLPALAAGHWLEPKEIIAGLNQNAGLRQATGLASAQADPKLPRLLLIRVDREKWETVPAEKRLELAQDWYDTWRHNVEQGIVAVLDAKTDKSLVNFDGAGKARLVAGR